MSTHGIATRPASGETANGDRALVVVRGAVTIYGVIDGLGHGPKAEEAALAAVEAIEGAAQTDVGALFDAVHGALRATRGAAMTLLVVQGTRCEAAGVGNVAIRARDVRGLSLAHTPGIVGGQMRALRVARGDVLRGARIAIWSDGISSRAPIEGHAAETPSVAAERILAAHAVSHDDATILIADL